MGQKILIIGGVAAGPKTACRLNRLDPEAEITIIDQDNLISYGGCGIPYYISGDVSDEKELRNTSFHTTRDESFFINAKGVTVLTRTRVLAINRNKREVEAENLDTGTRKSIKYDKLVITTGSQPYILPIPGVDLDGVFIISDLHKAITIKERLARGEISKAVIIGGGAIGLEMAESFADLWGVTTSLIEFMPQLLPNILDSDFAGMLAKHMRDHGVNIYLGEAAQSIEADLNGKACKVITANREIEADIVIMAAGVRPRAQLAEDSGLLVSKFGIVVNNRLQTSDPDIYAAGDCIENTHLVSGKKCMAPMGSLANREGRIVADNLAGIPSTYEGWIGSFVMKAFECCVGGTGLSYQTAKAEGFDADYVISAQSDRAHFFPEQAVIPLQMVFDRKTRRVLGLQGFGPMNDAVLARIDAAAALIAKGGTIDDFSKLEMAYAPPFATALDALNATANVADNKASGRLQTISITDFMAWMDNLDSHPDWVALDIRHPAESEMFVKKYGARWLPVPYVNIRQRYRELPTDKTMIIICDAGTRSYEIQRFLDYKKFHSLVLGGGFNCIRRIGADWWPSK
ncbi:MAG: FAD-dependent oxidoreductase [Proteobacteria bacterium]|nr:FAD-dependent oxidoreductase [Pseudomonadota bacterium]MBU1717247.1 FAD-dependent oxidoreductase [Pseudomonadota bacterium]